MLIWLMTLPTWILAIIMFLGAAALLVILGTVLSVYLEDFS